jgi:hypothetical protein
VPEVVITNYQETSPIDQWSTNFYRVLYSQDGRAWVVLGITLEISTTSDFWRFTRLAKHGPPVPYANCSILYASLSIEKDLAGTDSTWLCWRKCARFGSDPMT